MLQFNTSLYNSTLKLFPYWRLSSLLSTSVVNPETSNASKQDDSTIIQDHESLMTKNKVLQDADISSQNPSKILNSIKNIQQPGNFKSQLNNMIKNARSTEDLIGIMKSPGITIDHVRQILSLISSKSTNEKQTNVSLPKTKDSTTKLDMKKIEMDNSKMLPFATPFLIQVLKKLCFSSDRNVPLLKTLSHNIILYSERLNIKMCGDILYSLSVLNYFDESLLKKVMLDLCQEIPQNTKAPVFGSIVTSIGLLRYKNTEVLDVICKWTVDNYSKLRIQDFVATLQCFATFGYNPLNMSDLQEQIYLLKRKDIPNNELWLDFVWSLTILGKALPSHVSSVLETKFVEEILKVPEQKHVSKILKLLNINGAAQYLLQNYSGPLLNTSADIFPTSIERKKQRLEFVDILNETLTEIAPLCFQTNVYTKMGFFIDAECYLNSNNEFVRINNISNDTSKRLAIMIHDYYDYSRGKEDLLGVVQFYNQILNAKGYKVLNISYHNFSVNDKLIKRIKYLNEQIESIRDP